MPNASQFSGLQTEYGKTPGSVDTSSTELTLGGLIVFCTVIPHVAWEGSTHRQTETCRAVAVSTERGRTATNNNAEEDDDHESENDGKGQGLGS